MNGMAKVMVKAMVMKTNKKIVITIMRIMVELAALAMVITLTITPTVMRTTDYLICLKRPG